VRLDRDAVWSGVIVGVDPDPANCAAITNWARGYYDALHACWSGRSRHLPGNYDRLAAIKARYDPENLFRVNQNIQPSGGSLNPGSGTNGGGIRVARDSGRT
jgi:hypothetical protein